MFHFGAREDGGRLLPVNSIGRQHRPRKKPGHCKMEAVAAPHPWRPSMTSTKKPDARDAGRSVTVDSTQ